MFNKYVLEPVLESIGQYGEANAFFIDGNHYTYNYFANAVSAIRAELRRALTGDNVGLVANDDVETYASILALWLEGCAYIPLHPLQPVERNNEIILQSHISLVLDSESKMNFPSVRKIFTSNLSFDKPDLQPKQISDDSIAYILFTSGSTGKPKGVPITRRNIGEFTKAFWDIGYTMDHTDRVLQPFDLTFDLSVMSYLMPLTKGACVYTVPHDQIKYNYIAGLLDDQSLTFALMVPSTIRYLRPYFDEINLPSLRYNLFCGEALPLDLITEWSKCIPNATIDNVYGPTEDTIFCSQYRFQRDTINKSYNGVLSIGKSMTSGTMIVVDENNNRIAQGEQGELCLAGLQLTPGYWNNPEKNKQAFFTDNSGERFYRTGDICFEDANGDFMYCGRADSQVKVQGYRIELGEIEYHVRESLQGRNAVAVAFENGSGNTEIALFIEGELEDPRILMSDLKTKMPSYMEPSRIKSLPEFPLNSNGKVDRNKLKEFV
jgi:amino acid adenylation domain-containing protein